MNFYLNTQFAMGDFNYSAELWADSEIMILFGHSGAGKSLTLQMAAGLIKPQSGHIVIDGQVVFDGVDKVNVPTQQRKIAYVVQNLALFPHMNVLGNIMFGASGNTAQRKARVQWLMRSMELTGLDHRMPATLSGGQTQRVALARALARDARVVLLDEPFSALDQSLRREMRSLLVQLKRDWEIPIVMVTHDLREAYLLADKLAVMDNGTVLHQGDKDTVFDHPLSSREAKLTGIENLIPATVTEVTPQTIVVNMLGGRFVCESVAGPLSQYHKGANVIATIRAERINLRRGAEPLENVCRATIRERFSYGDYYTLGAVSVDGKQQLEVSMGARPFEVLRVANQDEWALELPAKNLHAVPV